MKIIVATLFLFSAALFCLAQEKPQAVLINEWEKIHCDQFGGIVDNFLYTVHQAPDSAGYAVIYSRENLSDWSRRYVNQISDAVAARKIDPSRIKIVRVKKDVEIEIKFWKVPAGAEPLVIEGSHWPGALPSSQKPFVFTTSSDWDGGVCYDFAPGVYADFLKANPTARGHVVVYDTDAAKARKEAAGKLKLLSEYDIPPSRLRVFYAKPPKHFLPYTEFWLVPPKKKK
jgi:hypothetical protein